MTLRTIAALAAFCIVTPAMATDPMAKFAWLEGCWSVVGGEPGSDEQWMAPAGGTMLGMARTVRKGAAVQYEFMRIAERAKGQYAFIAIPSGQAETPFDLVRHDANTLVFERKHQDFPTRVIYSRGANGAIHGRIEGKIDGKDRAIDFPMQRAACR